MQTKIGRNKIESTRSDYFRVKIRASRGRADLGSQICYRDWRFGSKRAFRIKRESFLPLGICHFKLFRLLRSIRL